MLVSATLPSLPSCYVRSSGGVSIDANCDGIVDSATVSNSSTYLGSTSEATVVNGINARVLTTNFLANNVSVYNSINAVQASVNSNATSLTNEINNRITNDTALGLRIDSVNASSLASSNFSQYTNVSNLVVNTSTLKTTGGVLDIVLSWFTGLFYQKSEVYNKTEIDNSLALKLNISDQRYNDTVAITNVQTSVTGNATSLTTEISNRQSNDSYLQQQINAVSAYNDTGIYNAVGSVNNSLNNEISNRQSNDTAINSRIDVVNSTANSLGNWSADKASYALDSRVTTVNGTITTEISNRQTNDTALGLRIDNINTTSTVSGLYTNVTNLQTSVTGNASALTTETANRISNDSLLNDKIISVNDSALKNNSDATLNNVNITGELTIKDNQSQMHYMSLDLSSLDSMQSNTVQGNIMFDYNTSTLIVYNANSNILITNIGGNDYYIVGNQSVDYVSGTNSTPVNNYMYFAVSGETTVLTRNSAYPDSVSHIDIAQAVVGDVGNYYYASFTPTSTKQFVYKVYDQARYSFNKYISGFSPTVNSTYLSFTTGEYWDTLHEVESSTNLSMVTNGFYLVLYNGTFVQCNDLSCITEYNDGNTIEANAYFNVLWGVVPTSDNTSRIIAIPQNKPSAIYTTASSAEQDRYNTITDVVNHPEITKAKMLLIKTIVRNSANTFSAFASGSYYQSIVGVSSAGASAGGTNDHSLLNNLDYASSGHTGFASQTELDTKLNITDQRYNDTAIINVEISNRQTNDTALGNKITSVNNTVNSLGNWSADKSSYTTTSNLPVYNNLSMTQVVSGVGNWSADKASYALDSRVTTVNGTITTEISNRQTNDTALGLRIDNINTTSTVSGLYTNVTNLQTSVSGNASSLTNEINNRISNDSLKANLNSPTFTGTPQINGRLILNQTLNVLDGAGNNGTTVIGDTIWTNTVYVTNIGSANILNPMNINGSNIPYFDNQFDNGNSSNRWRNISGNQINGNIIYENGVSLVSKYAQTTWNRTYADTLYYAISNPNNYYNSSTIPSYALNTKVDSLGNWTADKASYATLTNLASVGNWTADKSSYALDSRVTTVNNTLTSVGNYSANGMPKAGGTFTGNITMSAGVTTILTPSANKFYIWYVNTTFWDCYNGTGTIYNRGNASVTC
jgi:hypothetical protein